MSFTSPIQKLAQEFAYADIATQAANLQNEQAELDAESNGLDSLSSALTDFQSAIDALNSDTDGPLTFSATSNNDANTVSANSQAQAGTYSFYVTKLAEAQQTTFSMSDDTFSASGTFELTMDDGTTMDIDLAAADEDGDSFIDASELVDAINDSDDNPGVSAALVKTDGTTTIMLTSDTTGAQSAFSVSVTGNTSFSDQITTSQNNVTDAQDAEIHLGSQTGPEITSSTNTFDDVIPGVTMTFTEASDPDDPDDLTTFTIAEDSSGSQAKVQTFVDAYNTLIDTIDSLTSYGDEDTAAGVFAGDAGMNSLANQMDDIAHASYGGVSIVDYGITLDSDGLRAIAPQPASLSTTQQISARVKATQNAGPRPVVERKTAGVTVNPAPSTQSLLNTAAQGNQPVNPLTDHNIVSTQASSPVTMSTEELGEKLTALLKDRIQFQIGQQQQVSTIRLDPPSLGKLEIAVQLDAGKLMVHIGANQSDVCRSLQQFSDNLRQHLTAQNFMEVNVQVSSEGQSQQQKQQSGHQQDEVTSALTLNDEPQFQQNESILIKV